MRVKDADAGVFDVQARFMRVFWAQYLRPVLYLICFFPFLLALALRTPIRALTEIQDLRSVNVLIAEKCLNLVHGFILFHYNLLIPFRMLQLEFLHCQKITCMLLR